MSDNQQLILLPKRALLLKMLFILFQSNSDILVVVMTFQHSVLFK